MGGEPLRNPIKSVRKKGRFNLFFMEMIIVLLFFSIAAVIILRSFAASDRLAKESRRLENMTFCAQSAAEIYSRTASVSETAKMLFDGSGLVFIDGVSAVRIPVSSECKYSPASPELFMTMLETEEHCENGRFMKLEIIFSDSRDESVYKVESGAYVSERERSVSGIE